MSVLTNRKSEPTIHVLTVHWNEDCWIPVQLRHIRRNIDGPVRLWSFLNGLDDDTFARWSREFDFASRQPIEEHETKLDLMAELVSGPGSADPADILLFLDGDAVPIAPLRPWLEKALSKAPLVAVQRLENLGDPQPHPCFTATTVGFWNQIGGTWEEGTSWINTAGDTIDDVGGELMARLDELGESWSPILRSNTHDIHPVMFGVYGDVIYHHGAGFYPTIGQRVGAQAAREQGAILDGRPAARLRLMLPKRRRWRNARRNRAAVRMRADIRSQVRAMSEAVFAEIETNETFYKAFTETGYDSPMAAWKLELVPERWLLPSQRSGSRGGETGGGEEA